MEGIDLITQAKRGDDAAFAILFQQNYPFVIKYLVKITFNLESAEELAQETMVKCIEKISMYNGKSKFSTWLITIATNLFIDQKRKIKREQNWQNQEMALRKMKWHYESKNEEWNDVMEALGKLSDDIRIPIILKHYYSYSYEEIGKMLNLAEGTVKSRVHNGILAVRKELKLNGEEEPRKEKQRV